MSTVTAASTIASRTRRHRFAHRPPGVIAWLPTWKQMPSASDAWRAANSKGLHLARLGAELGGEAELGMLRADPQADQQVEIGRRDAVRRGRADDLLQLLERIEAEGLHAMLEIGLGDGFLGLHRVHEARAPPPAASRHQAHFADRGDVIMRDALVPQDPQQVRRRIGLDRIERPARETSRRRSGRRGARHADGEA